MILIINNRDSFVFNLDRYFRELEQETLVIDAHQNSIADVAALSPNAIIISPGPCTPEEAGISVEVIERFSGEVPILGVCLGHQAIGKALGAEIVPSELPTYGRAQLIDHDGEGLFVDIASPLRAGLYHSLVVRDEPKPPFIVQARSPAREIMALRHPTHLTFGLQFHPESVLSHHGHKLLHNFLALAGTFHDPG